MLAILSLSGKVAPVNISVGAVAAILSSSASRLSPVMTATLRSRPCSFSKARVASPQDAGLTPPALAMIFTPCPAIARAWGFRTALMKSPAKPMAGSLAWARAMIDMVISAR